METSYGKFYLNFCDDPDFVVPSDDVGKRLARIAVDVDRWLDGGQKTLVHGDFKSGNIFVEQHTRATYAIDWQWTGWGVAAHDVIYFFATSASDDFLANYQTALWMYHFAFVSELDPGLRHSRPWPYHETHRMFKLATLDFMRWAFASRFPNETPKNMRKRNNQVPKDINQGEYRRSLKRLKFLCDLVELFLPEAKNGDLGVQKRDVA